MTVISRAFAPALCLLLVVSGCGGSADPAGAPVATTSEPPPTATDPARGLIIVTTTDLVARSRQLAPFIADKQRRGLHVQLVTEADYGGAARRGPARAALIRDYLRGIAREHRYLLLLGDPDPQHGDVPMFTVWPRHAQPEGECLGAFATDCRSCESDAPYADLRGDWDLDRDGRLGEHGRDDGPGGISFEAQLVVGRIPVYFGDAAEADRILAHAMAYAGQTAEEARYRRRVLLPASIFYYRGQRLTGTAMLSDVDGASFADWLVRHELAPHPELSFTRLYEREGARPSAYPSDGALTQQAVLDAFGEGAGVVIWAGHGMPRHVVRTVWREDSDGDGFAGAAELTSPPLLRAQDVDQIAAGRPGFAVASSCEVGSAEIPYNLSHSLLLAGAVVGIAASSSVTPGSGTGSPSSGEALQREHFGSDNAAAVILRGLLDGRGAAEALAEAKRTLGEAATAEDLAGKMMINHFGDPTLTLDDLALDDLALDDLAPADSR